jgi:hypothetical protein
VSLHISSGVVFILHDGSANSNFTQFPSTPLFKMAAPVLAIVPLYIYPTNSAAWAPLITSLSANTTVDVQVIINPNSGPGDTQYPDSNYIAAIAELNSYSNVQTVCYVPTSWANRAITDVETDVSTCAGWASYTEADIHMDGIFFDEAVYEYNDTTSSYMSSITSYAQNALGSGRDTIIFNPGTVVSTSWYGIADYIVAFENSYSAYSDAVLSSIPSTVRGQSQFIIYGFTGDTTDQTTLVNDLVAGGIGTIFITTQTVYTAWSSLWAQFCAALAAA